MAEEVDLLEREWTRAAIDKVNHHPGKFEDEPMLAEILYELSEVSGFDEDIGNVAELGWYGKFDGLELKGIPQPIYAILMEDNLGFEYVREFKSHAELEKMWHEIEKDYEPFYKEE